MIEWKQISESPGKPYFDNLLAVFRREVTDRPTLFEFIF
jgi:hypothetical protein